MRSIFDFLFVGFLGLSGFRVYSLRGRFFRGFSGGLGVQGS